MVAKVNITCVTNAGTMLSNEFQLDQVTAKCSPYKDNDTVLSGGG